ncbi:MAG: hypothetical protein AAF348_18785 [Bacteroidota bacterium]
MKVKELKKYLEKLDDEMPVGLLDLTTDDETYMNYSLREEDLDVNDYWTDNSYPEPKGKMLFICFENKLNENPI